MAILCRFLCGGHLVVLRIFGKVSLVTGCLDMIPVFSFLLCSRFTYRCHLVQM